jgi:hypothetical protein
VCAEGCDGCVPKVPADAADSADAACASGDGIGCALAPGRKVTRASSIPPLSGE